ncbi:hypothetical protein CAPTEDRAFT_94830 [Capitella teleta]|uniref:HAT C-terminal dimerisation domain-containing protein n=1 Tax=Capitella teleta TaxID=283909 RepID=R7UJG8_CAPTE|nr:hypothetical protein CAPTEDRAFT_94830 [Capitella teleta]|eukprot:ELU06248.1 hypothetical protein CAPTEDRAFT_94830 [Capitella teleta]
MARLFAAEESSSVNSQRPDPTEEVVKYWQIPQIKPSEDPLAFWRERRFELPHLASLARKYSSVQGSSVASERIFSSAGNIVNAKRSCIDPVHVDQLIFLHKFLK